MNTERRVKNSPARAGSMHAMVALNSKDIGLFSGVPTSGYEKMAIHVSLSCSARFGTQLWTVSHTSDQGTRNHAGRTQCSNNNSHKYCGPVFWLIVSTFSLICLHLWLAKGFLFRQFM